MAIVGKHLLTLLFFLITALLVGCSTHSVEEDPTQPLVDTQKPATYAEYKIWRDRYDSDAKAYAEYKAWEAQYRLWQQQNNR